MSQKPSRSLAAFAGKTFDGDPNLTQQQVLEKATAVNQWGMYYSCFAVVPQMKKQKSGKIIICSSNGAFKPTAPAYEYHMAKGACESLTVAGQIRDSRQLREA